METLDNGDVIRVEEGLDGINQIMFMPKDLEEFMYQNTTRGMDQLFNNGVKCTLLQPGSADWRSGTIYFRVHFEEDEPESSPEIEAAAESSPLDDIRRLEMGSES